MARLEKMVEVFEITERKDGCVYRTKSHGLHWVDIDAKRPHEDIMYASPSTHVQENQSTFRRVSD